MTIIIYDKSMTIRSALMQDIGERSLPGKLFRIYTSMIENGELKSGDKLETVRKIAEKYKVSVSTASQAIKMLTESGWVDTLVGSGTYVRKNLPASPVRNSQSISAKTDSGTTSRRVLYFFFNVKSNTRRGYGFYAKILCALQREVEANNFELKICSMDDVEAIRKASVSPDVLGVTYMPEEDGYPLEYFKKHGVTEVLFGMDEKDVVSHYISPDNYSAGWMVAEYLHRHGHSDVAFVTGFHQNKKFMDRHFKYRLQGFVDYYEYNSLPSPRCFSWDVRIDNGTSEVMSLIAGTVSKDKTAPTAIAVAGKNMADEIIKKAQFELGVRDVAEHVSLISFEDASSDVDNNLTIATLPPEVMAHEIIELIKRLAQTPAKNRTIRLNLSMDIVENGSVKDIG